VLFRLGPCAAHALTITNTLFCIPVRFETTWRHVRSTRLQLLKYAIIRKRNRKAALVTRTTPSAGYRWTDHHLLIKRLRMSIRRKLYLSHYLPFRQRFNVSKLFGSSIHDGKGRVNHEKLMIKPIDPQSVEQ